MKILIIVTSTGTFANGKLATGLWLSEFTHIYHSAKESGYDITVANPKGGYTPIDPESLKAIFLDEMSKSIGKSQNSKSCWIMQTVWITCWNNSLIVSI